MSEASECREVDDNISEVLEGIASDALFDHIASCDRCRDARHEAEQLARRVADAGGDYRLAADLEARLLRQLAAESTAPHDASHQPERAAANGQIEANLETALARVEPPATEPRAAALPAKLPPAALEAPELAQATPTASGPRSLWVWLSAAAAVLLGVLWLSSRPEAPLGADAVHGAWQGEVLEVQRGFSSPSGLLLCTADAACAAVGVGAPIPAGAALETDGLTRARVRLGDDTRMTLDRASRLQLDAGGRRHARLTRGKLVAELQPRVDEVGQPARAGVAARAVIETAQGRAEVMGTKFALRAEPELSRVEVSRGEVRLVDVEDRGVSVRAGEAGVIGGRAAPRVESVLDLAPAFTWSSAAFEPPSETQPGGALGELRAKRPGAEREQTGAVVLSEHHVEVRIVDNVARTEVEEVFTNQTDEVLEGIYRFPLPPGAQIERLALDVDGKLVDGAFVDRQRAAAIWRGAIVNSGGKKPAPSEEIIWVPGPWKDPALLEWQRGNRFELRIFPIPRRGARRIVLAYTQVLPPSEGGRQYVYPLPQDPGGTTRVERFTFDAEVRGHDATRGVVARGYPLAEVDGPSGVARLAFDAEHFSPTGDLALSYELPSSAGALRGWAYQPSSPPEQRRSDRGRGDPRDAVPSRLLGSVPDDAPFVALALRPQLPRRAEHQARDFVLVVDASRSMIGESYRRAIALVERIINEMDRYDRVSLLACDSVCQSLPGGYRVPGEQAAEAAARFLRSIEPEGASDLAFAIERAAARSEGGAERVLRVVYVGDGTPTVGPIHPALLGRAVAAALPGAASLTAVAVGSDADRASLEVATEAAGGVTLTFAPGQSVEEVAYAALGAAYGRTLENARLTLPEGLVAVAPARLGSIAAGAEELVVARMRSPEISGEAVLSGELAGERFEQRYSLALSASTSAGNAFVPRLYAAVALAELERSMDESARRESIALSTRFNVASRYTSLLVLESAAMFEAFGLDNRRLSPEWSGQQDAERAQTWGDAPSDDADEEGTFADVQQLSEGAAIGSAGSRLGGFGSGKGASGAGRYAAAPPAAAAPRPQSSPPSAAPGGDFDLRVERSAERRRSAKKKESSRADVARDSCGCALSDWECQSSCRPAPTQPPELGGPHEIERPRPLPLPVPRRMIPMRRVWDRVGSIQAPPRLLDAAEPRHRAALEARVHEQELRRSALKELYVVDFLAGDLERAADVAERWSSKDPLDPDALTARADLAAQRGERDLAIRILGSVVDVRPGDYKAQWRLARLHRWAGAPARGCRHSLAVAQLMLQDEKLVAEGVRCARDVGQASWAEDLLAAVTPTLRGAVERLAAAPRASDELSGDLRVEASWHGAEHDLDLVILHPEGFRVSWLGAPTRSVISATDVLSVHREGLALRGAGAGQYAIEIVRSSPGLEPVRGSLELVAGKARRSVPFVLTGERLRVATAEIKLASRLVPVEGRR